MTQAGVIGPDPDILSVQPFLQRHSDTPDAAAVSDGVAVVKADNLVEHRQV